MDLRSQLAHVLKGRICWVGIGNPDYGDDVFGLKLAEVIQSIGVSNVVIAGNTPERWVETISHERFDHVVFLDAVEFGGESGSVVFLNSHEIETKFPQVSTHKISLGMLAKLIEVNGTTKVWLLGVQPQSMKTAEGMSNRVKITLDILKDVIGEVLGAAALEKAGELSK